MKLISANGGTSQWIGQFGQRGSARPILLALVSFALGVGVTAAYFVHNAKSNGAQGQTAPSAASSQWLDAPPPTAPASPPPPHAPPPTPIDPAVIAEVKLAIPDFATQSLQGGENILRANALKDMAAAAAQIDQDNKAAAQQLSDAQNGGSAADQQAAMKHVQDTQLAGTQKLKDIAARLQAQIDALKNLKNQQ